MVEDALCSPAHLVPSPAHLDHAVQRLLILGSEDLPNVKHVQLAPGDHDADQGVVSSPQALEDTRA